MTFAIIPAAGHSSRMGRPKLSLPLGKRTVLEHAIDALRQGGVDRVLVVVAPHVAELVPLANAAGAEVCLLSESTSDMRTTVERGLGWLEERYRPQADDYWLLAPGDHPAIAPAVVRELLVAAGRNGKSIIVPVHGGRRGHPTAISWKHVAGIRALPASEGINTYLREHAAEMLQLEVNEPGVLVDLDTPEDYQKLSSLGA